MWQVEEGESEVDVGGVKQRATRTGVNTTHFVYNFSLSDFWLSVFVCLSAFGTRTL